MAKAYYTNMLDNKWTRHGTTHKRVAPRVSPHKVRGFLRGIITPYTLLPFIPMPTIHYQIIRNTWRLLITLHTACPCSHGAGQVGVRKTQLHMSYTSLPVLFIQMLKLYRSYAFCQPTCVWLATWSPSSPDIACDWYDHMTLNMCITKTLYTSFMVLDSVIYGGSATGCPPASQSGQCHTAQGDKKF